MESYMKSKAYFLKQLSTLFQSGLKEFSAQKNQEEKIEQLELELTFRCNSKCIMCDLWREDREYTELRKQELTLKEIKKFVSQSRLLNKLKRVVLIGGEPFLRKDIVEIAGFFLQRYPKISLGIFSNLVDTERVLTQTQKIVKQYRLVGNLWFNSSLDGIGVTHDMIRGKKCAFDSLLRTLKKLHREFPQIPCGLVFTIVPRNHKEILPAFELAEELDCSFSAQFAIQYEGAEKFYWDEKQLDEVQRQVNIIFDKLCVKLEEVSPLLKQENPEWYTGILTEILFWRYLVEYVKRPQRYLRCCFAGKSYVRCGPDGNLYLCPPYRKMRIGNIKDSNFDELWLSERTEGFRRYIDQGKCHCWHLCSIIPVAKKIFSTTLRYY